MSDRARSSPEPSEAARESNQLGQPYGDLVELNTCRQVLDSVGRDVLGDVVHDYLDLLESSAAVYEINGDYAHGIFSSGWCRMLDGASRALCATDDNRRALGSGKWHCHESCWKTSHTSMQTERPADFECLGGIRIYAVPIRAAGHVVGSINFGYGDPPRDPATLATLAERYRLPPEELRRQAEAYDSRAPHDIETAKRRLHVSARLIGALVERKLAQDEAQRLQIELEERIRARTAELEELTNELRRQAEEARRDRDMIEAIREAETRFISAEEPLDVFEHLLDSLLSLTTSEYGFIDEVCRSDDGVPYAKARAITNIAWNDETRSLWEGYRKGNLNFYNLQSLWGSVITTGAPVIANDAPNDPRRSGVPPGHPPLNHFLGIPLHSGGELVGLIGLANRPGGYSHATVTHLAPIVAACANILKAWRSEQSRRAAEDELRRVHLELESAYEALGQRSEAALRDSAERLDLAVQGANLGVWHWNIATGELVWSDKCKQLFGLPLDSTMSYQRFLDALLPEDRDRTDRTVARSLADRSDYDIEYRARWPDGSVHWLAAKGRASYDDGGRPLRMQGVVIDISERKQTEQALRHTAAELARSNEELQQFAYVASHDLQEPLRMVASYVDLLARRYKGRLDADADDFIGYAIDGATRMRQLIDDLLTYSRIGTQGRNSAPTDCAGVLRNVLVDLQEVIAASDATITHDPLPTVQADEVQLRRLLQNLIGNAIKFRGSTAPRVHVGVQREGTAWRFSVRDNGIGIDPQHFERIFVIFQRLVPRSEYPGTGIGLAISKRIVARHGGRLWVESTPGAGSTFFFTIPDAKEA